MFNKIINYILGWRFGETPPSGTWCWVTDGVHIWIACWVFEFKKGQWTNGDTWEDFDNDVIAFKKIKKPCSPRE